MRLKKKRKEKKKKRSSSRTENVKNRMKRHNVHTYTMQCDVWVGDTSAHNTPDASLYIKKSKSTTNNGSKSFTHTHTRDLTPCALLLLHPAPEDFMHHYTEGCALVYSLHISNDNNEKKKEEKMRTKCNNNSVNALQCNE